MKNLDSPLISFKNATPSTFANHAFKLSKQVPKTSGPDKSSDAKPPKTSPPSWVMDLKLKRVAEIIDVLCDTEGYIRRNTLKQSKPKSKKESEKKDDSAKTRKTASELHVLENGGPGFHTFSISEVDNAPSDGIDAGSSEKKGRLVGLMVFTCRHAGVHRPKSKKSQRNRKNGKKECPAKITICFGPDYKPNGRDFNLADFGDLVVKVTWVYDHNHVVENVSRKALDEIRLGIRESTASGVSWREFLDKRNKLLLELQNDSIRPEVFLINYEQWTYESRRNFMAMAVKHKERDESLRLWAKEIQKQEGMAAFTKEFKFEDTGSEANDLEAPQGGKIWSFWCMSKWQAELLQSNCQIIFLDSTHKTCRGLRPDEDVYLFTLYVKNHITGKGAPAAFMITNSGRQEVISHFLRCVRNFAHFKPIQVVIDCDRAETNALKDIWGDEVSIVWCRWHILKAFANKVRTKVTLGARGDATKEEWIAHKAHIDGKKKQVTEAFRKVVNSPTKKEGEQRVQDFLKEFEEFPELIEYTARQWFANKQFVFNGEAKNFLVHASTNNFIESFHNVLKRYFLGKSRGQRPDCLIFRLFCKVETNYRAEELMVRQGFKGRVNDKGEKLAKEKAFAISNEDMRRMITFVSEGNLKMQSFSDSEVVYSVQLDEHNLKCSCKAYENSHSWCKHIFLGWRWWVTPICDDQQHENSSNKVLTQATLFVESIEALDGGVEDDKDFGEVCLEDDEDLESASFEGGVRQGMATIEDEDIITQPVATYEDETSLGDESPLNLEPLRSENSDPTKEQEDVSQPKNLTGDGALSFASLFATPDHIFANAMSDVTGVPKIPVLDPISLTAGERILKIDGAQPQILDYQQLDKIDLVRKEIAKRQANERDYEIFIKLCELYWKKAQALPLQTYNRSLKRVLDCLEREADQRDEASRKQRR